MISRTRRRPNQWANSWTNKWTIAVAGLVLAQAAVTHADPAPFDLAGPILEVKVTRDAVTLPVSQVPNLESGDRLWIKADLPATQSEHYLMVAVFLRGATNPPPSSWFFRCETWTRKCADEGLAVTVPDGAQQVLVFLAPETGGDFKTLMNSVRGRPGAFVRSSQDLNQATLDRSRLENYLSAIHTLNDTDPSKLKETAPLLARSLAIKVDEKCLDRIPELQAPCLMQGQNSLILNDGHSTSIVEALTSGPAADLAMEASYTPQLSYGYYSPYIASVLDIARIFDSFHTAHYQYIPALATQQGDHLALTLNTPPSFHDPKSVLVVALPAVEQAQLPPLHAVDPKDIYCARKNSLVLPVEGAPLVFSTGYAHDIVLSLTGKDGKNIDLPAKSDAERGGFVVDTSPLGTASLGDSIRGSLHGYWGFEKYDGPGFQLVNAHAQSWALAPNDDGSLIVGREDTIHLQAGSVSCIDRIMVKDPAGKELIADWKTTKPNEVEVKLPLQEAKPGALTLLVAQYGAKDPQPLELHAFSEAGHLDGFLIHAGEGQGLLKGSRLDEVASLTLKGLEFAPTKLTSSQGSDELVMVVRPASQDGSPADPQPTAQTTSSQSVAQAALAVPTTSLKQGDTAKARVTLRDGRVFTLNVSVDAPRPGVTLIGKSVLPSASSNESNIQLANENELPQDAKLTFSVRTRTPAVFAHDEKIEVATADESFSTTLSLANGGITLEDSKVAVATLDPAKAFGPSAFGQLQFRVIANGVAGDWQPLATLVRLPVLRELKCPATPDLACKLSGTNLFLVESVSIDPKFGHPVHVPDGFPGYSLPVPHPADGQLYVKLRDDPTVVNLAALGAQQLPPSPEEAARAPARHAAALPEHDTGSSASTPSPASAAPGNNSTSSSSSQPSGQLSAQTTAQASTTSSATSAAAASTAAISSQTSLQTATPAPSQSGPAAQPASSQAPPAPGPQGSAAPDSTPPPRPAQQAAIAPTGR